MAVTETTRESWASRLGNAVRGIIGGIALFIIGFPVLFWNEGNSVRTAKALAEGEGACISLESVASVDPDYEGRLVHASAKAVTDETLADLDFGVAVNAIRLERKVEMFQWSESSRTEEKKNLGGSVTKTTTYTYSKGWSEEAIDSSGFREPGHDNPGAMPFPAQERLAGEVRFGAFRLNEDQIGRIGGARGYEFATNYVCPVATAQRYGGVLYIPCDGVVATNARSVVSEPRIGDVRVSFSVIYPHEISIVAKQRGGTFSSYVAKNGKKISLLANGVQDAAEMFATARSNNATITWLIRLGGFILMFIGLSMVLKPLSVIADVLPPVGTVVELGTGVVAGTVAFVCALATIAVAWIFYRPVLGVALLAVAGLVAWRLVKRARERRAARQDAPAAAAPAP